MFKEGYKFFEQSLKNEELAFYRRCYLAIKNRQISITFDFKLININRAKEIIKYVYEDNPSFFYLSPYKLSYVNNKQIYFNYLYDKTTTLNYENQIKKTLMHFTFLADSIASAWSSMLLFQSSISMILSISNILFPSIPLNYDRFDSLSPNRIRSSNNPIL